MKTDVIEISPAGEGMAEALKEIGYNGYLTLEADRYLHGRTKENIFEGMQSMANAARRLDAMMRE